MNAGLSNLDTLRKHLLARTLFGDTTFDSVILDLGLGVAAFFEQYCNRNFQRATDDTIVFQADRATFTFGRYPIEQVTKVEGKANEDVGWVELESKVIQAISKKSGIVYFDTATDPGLFWNEIRFTFDGGFWWETAEPDDAAYPSTAPATAKILPNDLKYAWLMHCKDVWSAQDKLGIGMIDKPNAQSLLSEAKMSQQVLQMIFPYKQMQPI